MIQLIYSAISYVCFLVVFTLLSIWTGRMNNIHPMIMRIFPYHAEMGSKLDGNHFINNLLLLMIFFITHSTMTRRLFKKKIYGLKEGMSSWFERSTFVLIASAQLLAILVFWKGSSNEIWNLTNNKALSLCLQCLGMFGYVCVVYTTFAINHFDLFGLRQAYLSFIGKKYKGLPFQTNFPYNLARHPMMTGFMIAFWSTPLMTWSYLQFCVAMTLYIFVGVTLEETSLTGSFKETYENYSKSVGKFLPTQWLFKEKTSYNLRKRK